MRWLTLLVSVPPTPTRHRVGVWRKLKRMGAVALRGSAWILPETPETTERFQWLVQEVQTIGGEATLLRVDRIEPMTDAQVTALFHKARAPEYEAVLRGCRELAVQLDRYRTAHRGSIAQLKAKLEALKRELDRIAAIDYLQSPIGRRARETWEALAKRLRAAEARPAPGTARRRAALPVPGSVWVTRPRPHIDRIASAWLIKRFVDPQARFAFADAEDAPKKGIPYDILGAEFGHHGEDCTFETLLKRFGLKDRRLKTIAEIVHEVDLADGKFTRPESRGIDLALQGVAAATQDDQELLERGMTMFDGLYAVLRQKTGA
jgi:hypothetical protein